MRENIGLYRGKLKDFDEWIYWNIYGELTAENGKRKKYTITKGAKTRCYYYIYQLKQNIIPETVGEYTGFTDKNGKKIFEGDYWIDTDENDIFVVEFRNGKYCFVIYGVCGAFMEYGFDETAGSFGECDCVPMTDYYIKEIEIIGNVHDNSELLKGGAEE